MTGFDLHGAWTRRWVALDGGLPFETQTVIWLQAGPCYADVRVPFHPAGAERCFAGRSGWDGPQYRWTHHFDLEPGSPAADDIGSLRWNGDVLREEGVFPTAEGGRSYVEAWVPLGADGPYAAAESPRGMFVRVGRHAIGVVGTAGRLAAAYWREGDGGWGRELAIGDPRLVPSPQDGTPPGWTVVVEGDRVGSEALR
ncbi:MAG TPA: hypothetical protein VGI06_07310 [Acidimicrobiales bacterium]